ncbi:unnamed protein product [Rotaria sordida]|uniref:Uncharacterized protein n=1 Tax=Rotaria sordida TaxID=392033 RepID=A0A814ZWU9_9BILA|nr:unnamed protein product [Rotaria sordida]
MRVFPRIIKSTFKSQFEHENGTVGGATNPVYLHEDFEINTHTPTPTLSSPPNESLPPNESPPSHDSTTSKKSSSSNEPSPSNDFSTTKKTPPSNNSPSSNNSRPEKITIYTPTSTLKKIIKEISADIQELFPPLFKKKTGKTFDYNNIRNVKLIIGGGVNLSNDLIRNGFMLLNNHQINNEIQQQFPDRLVKHLIKQLVNNATFIKPVTYFQSESDIKKGNNNHIHLNIETTLNEQIPFITSNKIINFLLISSLNK